MTIRAFRGTTFLCLILAMSLTLTGCKALDGVVDFVKGVAQTVKGMFDKVKEVLKPIKDAVKAGKDAIKDGKAIVDIITGKDPGASSGSTSDGRTVKNPDDEDDSGSSAGTGPGGNTVTAPGGPGTSGLPVAIGSGKASSAAIEEAKKKAQTALVNVQNQAKSLQDMIGKIPETDATKVLNECLTNLKGLEKTLQDLAAGAITSETELDRYNKALENAKKVYDETIGRAQVVVNALDAAGKALQDAAKKVDWIGSIFGPADPKKPEETTKKPVVNDPAASSSPYAVATIVVSNFLASHNGELAKADADAIAQLLNEIKAAEALAATDKETAQAKLRDVWKKFRDLRAQMAGKLKVNDQDIRDAVAVWNLDRTDKLDPKSLSPADIGKLVENGYLFKPPSQGDQNGQIPWGSSPENKDPKGDGVDSKYEYVSAPITVVGNFLKSHADKLSSEDKEVVGSILSKMKEVESLFRTNPQAALDKMQSLFNDFQAIRGNLAAKLTVTVQDVRDAALHSNVGRRGEDRIDLDKITEADIGVLVKYGYLFKPPARWNEKKQDIEEDVRQGTVTKEDQELDQCADIRRDVLEAILKYNSDHKEMMQSLDLKVLVENQYLADYPKLPDGCKLVGENLSADGAIRCSCHKTWQSPEDKKNNPNP